MNKRLLVWLLPLLMVACAEPDYRDHVVTQAFSTCYKSANDDGTFECWESTSGGWKGIGYRLTDGDTTFVEHLSVSTKNGLLTYSVSVPTQNDAQTIDFPLQSESDSGLYFANPQHDFPQYINYDVVAGNLQAQVFAIDSLGDTAGFMIYFVPVTD